MIPLGAIHGLGEAGEKVGVVALALLAAMFVLGRSGRASERVRAGALLGALLLTPTLLVIDIWETSQLRHLRQTPRRRPARASSGH